LFQLLLDTGKVPKLWKYSIIRPVAKKPRVIMPNNFRPIAITFILCKTMEGVLANHLTSTVASRLVSLQFAYKSNRGTDDTLLLTLLMHPKANVRVLFVDL